MGGGETLAIAVKDKASQQAGLFACCAICLADAIAAELCLHLIKKLAIDNGLMSSVIYFAFVNDLADVNPIGEHPVKSAAREGSAAAAFAAGAGNPDWSGYSLAFKLFLQ